MPRPRRATLLRRNSDDGSCSASATKEDTMDIHLAGSRPTRRAPKEYFTGTVWQDPIIATAAPARIASTRVSFEPCARTNWHTHPLGQTLYVISGVGRVQTRSEPGTENRPAGVVCISPSDTPWHGHS